MRWFSVLTAMTLAVAWTAGATAGAQDAAQDAAGGKQFTLELNSARDAGGGCRVSFVAFNGTGVALDKTSYEVVVFDGEGLVAQFLILEFGRLPDNKTKVVQFDLAGQPCGSISRLLINDVAECVSGGEASTVCLDALKTEARTEIGFGV